LKVIISLFIYYITTFYPLLCNSDGSTVGTISSYLAGGFIVGDDLKVGVVVVP